MFDSALIRDLAETMGKSLTFKDIEAIGGYLFKDHTYSTHSVAGVDQKVSISPLKAARMLVEDCEKKHTLKELFAFVFELDGAPLNGRNIKLDGLETLLYKLSRSGNYYDYTRRKFVEYDKEKKVLPSWGVLKNGKEYMIALASVDVCQNSELVRKHKPAVMEKIYYRLWQFLRHKLDLYDGRIWTWAGDGGLFAFRGEESIVKAVSCCLEILYSLPVFNLRPDKPIPSDICLRIGMDFGTVKYFEDTGRIVSEAINYAAHLEKQHTKPMALSVSDAIYDMLPTPLKGAFSAVGEFEGRAAYATQAGATQTGATKTSAAKAGTGS
jgi:class 3 adenylate cyclase